MCCGPAAAAAAVSVQLRVYVDGQLAGLYPVFFTFYTVRPVAAVCTAHVQIRMYVQISHGEPCQGAWPASWADARAGAVLYFFTFECIMSYCCEVAATLCIHVVRTA